jgi:coproporphyrinogen III oxidase-like Fe-S oxidoreductase
MQDMIAERPPPPATSHYEVSAYAQPGRQARHNLNYWEFGDYLGIGAGAHSKISFPHRVLRQARFKQPKSYMERRQRQSGAGRARDRRDDMGFEFMLNTLRLTGRFFAEPVRRAHRHEHQCDRQAAQRRPKPRACCTATTRSSGRPNWDSAS